MGIIKNFFRYNSEISFPVKVIAILLLFPATVGIIAGFGLLIIGVGVGLSLYAIIVGILSLILSYGLSKLRRWAIYLFGIVVVAMFLIFGGGSLLYVVGFIITLIYHKDFKGSVIPGVKERYIVIAVMLSILIGVGFFAWQYYKISSERSVWKEYRLERITEDYDSIYYKDRRLIGIKDNGEKDIIVSSLMEAMRWKQTPGGGGEYPVEVSFPPYSSKIYIMKVIAGIRANGGFFEFNVNTLKYKKLKSFGDGAYFYKVSKDGYYLAILDNDDANQGVLSLLNLKEDTVREIAVGDEGERFLISGSSGIEFKWLDENIIQYPVYPINSSEIIELREVNIN